MNSEQTPMQELERLIDLYVDDLLDSEGLRRLEELLTAHPEGRRYFVRYMRMHTDLHVLAHARRAGDRALETIDAVAAQAFSRPNTGRRIRAVAAIAASIVCAVGVTWFLSRTEEPGASADVGIAWLVNAQNCRFADAGALREIRAGRTVELLGGLAELQFASGATVLLQGPARLEVLSARAAKLRAGRLAARVPPGAEGFEILAPSGRVIDLGTEFGLAVAEDGTAEVHVFDGKVQAEALGGTGSRVGVAAPEWARIAPEAVSVQPRAPGAGNFVRVIVPAPAIVPRTRLLDFSRPVEATLRDGVSRGIGLTHRLPGTGASLSADDGNLSLDIERAHLELTTTRSDINSQHRLDDGEYLGLRLADQGFTGNEDFEVSVLVPNIPALQTVGQFGLYAGTRSDRNIRGGLISREEPERYGQFLVNNNGGRDTDLEVIGLVSSGQTLRLTLARVDNRYTLTVEHPSTGAASTLTIAHPAFLDGEKDLYVGFFGANTASDVRKTIVVKELSVTVRTKVPPDAR